MTSEITMQTRKADGLAIRYAETDAHDEPTLLLLSPWPESIYAWELRALRRTRRPLLASGDGPVPRQADR
jgi:pimeloyl-ACP methyl ester carboxylesterase